MCFYLIDVLRNAAALHNEAANALAEQIRENYGTYYYRNPASRPLVEQHICQRNACSHLWLTGYRLRMKYGLADRGVVR